MKGNKDKCIAILSSSANHRTEFIQIYNDISHTSSNFEFGTELIEYDTTNSCARKPDGVIILFDLYSRNSYEKACQLSTQVKVHKLLLGNKMPPAIREVTFDEANEQAVKLNCFYHEIDMTDTSSIKESISFLLNRINELEFGSKYRFKIPISLRGKIILKNLSILVTVLTGISGLAVLIIGAITSLLVDFQGRWLGDSLIYSGCLTFMVCFLGFYGTRIENIREYLKINCVISACNLLYKTIIVILFLDYDYEFKREVDFVITPTLIVAIIIDLLSCFCMIAQMKTYEMNYTRYARSYSAFSPRVSLGLITH